MEFHPQLHQKEGVDAEHETGDQAPQQRAPQRIVDAVAESVENKRWIEGE